MEFFRWKDSFSVNNKEMDKQHKKFFSLLNKLYESAEKQGGDKDEFQKIHQAFSEYADQHFQNEEELCKIYDYPELKNQVNQHQFFREEVQRLGENFVNCEPIATKTLLVFLRDWLINHILLEDKGYKNYLQEADSEIV